MKVIIFVLKIKFKEIEDNNLIAFKYCDEEGKCK